MVQRRSRSRTRDDDGEEKKPVVAMRLQLQPADAGGGLVPFAEEPNSLDAIPAAPDAVDFLGCSDRVNALAVDARGRRLLAASSDETARVWSIPTRELLGVLRHADFVNCVGVVMAPDRGGGDNAKQSAKGTVAITGCEDGNVTVWNLDTFCVEYQLKPCYAAITALTVFHPEEDVCAAAALFDVYLISCWGRSVLRRFALRCDATSVCFSKDAHTLYVGQQDGSIACWDVAGAFVVRQLIAEPQPSGSNTSSSNTQGALSTSAAIRALAVDCTQQGGGGAFLISASDSGTVSVWSTSTGDLLHTSYAHAGKPVMALCVMTHRRKRRDGGAGGGGGRTPKAVVAGHINRAGVGSLATSPRGAGGATAALASPSKVISPKFHDATRTIFVSCGFDGTVHYHDLDTFAAVDGHGIYGYCMAPMYDADSNTWQIAVGDNQGRVKVFASANPVGALDALSAR